MIIDAQIAETVNGGISSFAGEKELLDVTFARRWRNKIFRWTNGRLTWANDRN